MEIPENYNVFFYMSASDLANEIPVFYMRTFWSREYIGLESYSSDLDTYVGTTCE